VTEAIATRPRIRSRWSVAGAVSAQFSQAFGSFLLQILAARLLGKEGLAVFAVLFGLIVVGTAIVSGFVGDSLTVLDRMNVAVRAGLQWWLIVLSTALGVLAGVGLGGSHYLSWPQAVAFGLAGAAFVAEDSIRRLLMASLRFWSIVIVDLVGLVGSVGLVAAVHWSGGDVSLTHFLTGLLLGQVAAIVVGAILLPAEDRWWARRASSHAASGDGARGGRAQVFEYGKWRALQVSVRPTMLSVMRVIAVAGIGRAAYGELEGARLFVAPAMLAVNGASSYLFARFARTRDISTLRLLRQADKGVIVLSVVSLLLGVLAAFAAPSLGGAMIGKEFDLDRWSVLGWSVYAAATAAATPYGVLAAVRGRQAATLVVRVIDSVLSLAGVAVVVSVDWSASAIPYVMGVFALCGGIGIRQLLVADVAAERVA
jgi:O-antigen/teichoic acid export membrane protein